MWFKNLIIYRIIDGTVDLSNLNEALSEHQLQSCLQMQMQSHGWVKPKADSEEFTHVCDQHVLIALGLEKKLLPAGVINQYAKDRATTMEQQQGHAVSKRQAKTIKEAVINELMPRAFVQRQAIYAWIDLTQQIVVIDTANLKQAETVVELLLKTISTVRLAPFSTNVSPATVMTRWLSGDEPPAVFTIDRDCELQSVDNEKSLIRYTQHDLDRNETVRYIKAGKKVKSLAMTWTNSISFVLHESLQIKRIVPLDILKESTNTVDADDLFDSDFALMTGELSRLLPDLFHALGGEDKAKS